MSQSHNASQAPKRALFVGRFQPFHKGHLHAVRQILKKFDELILLIGSAETLDSQNPFSSGERISFIRAALPKGMRSRIILVPVRDVNDNFRWVSHCLQYLPSFDEVFSNNSLVKRLFSEKGFKVSQTLERDRLHFQGSTIRDSMNRGEPWEHLVPKNCVPLIQLSLQRRLNRQ